MLGDRLQPTLADYGGWPCPGLASRTMSHLQPYCGQAGLLQMVAAGAPQRSCIMGLHASCVLHTPASQETPARSAVRAPAKRRYKELACCPPVPSTACSRRAQVRDALPERVDAALPAPARAAAPRAGGGQAAGWVGAGRVAAGVLLPSHACLSRPLA